MSLDETLAGLEMEDSPVDLSTMADEPKGAWPKGWYPAEIIEGYQAGSYMFTTSEDASKKGDSRNLRVCFRLKRGSEERTTFKQYNYRVEDFTQARIETVKSLRKEFGGVRGKWVGFEDQQRSSITLGQLGQLQVAVGVPFVFHPETKGIVPMRLVGVKVDVRLIIDEETGYNEVNAVAVLGQGGKTKVVKA